MIFHNRQRRAEVAVFLLSYKSTHDWLLTIVTTDETWYLYVHNQQFSLCS